MGEHGPSADGLEGVVAADTELSLVDGAAGELVIRGWPVGALAASGRFEDALALLWEGRRATDDDVARLGAARAAGWPRVERAVGAHADPTVALRAAAAAVDGPEQDDGLGLVALVGLTTAAWARWRSGQPLVAPDPALDHAQDLVRMIRGAADPARGRALGRYLCTVCDHGMNASTFAARVVASTGSDTASAVVAGIGALKGPLHGGAPGPVLDMLDAIGAPERASGWIAAELAAGRRIMGMGHRVYRVRDPRVAVLEAAIAELTASASGDPATAGRLALARAVEAEAEAALARRKPDRPLKANVEFATAVLLDAIGIPREAFTATFAVGRVAGWIAHVAEQRAVGRLIRPASRYVGPRQG
jgi:citrate synthase